MTSFFLFAACSSSDEEPTIDGNGERYNDLIFSNISVERNIPYGSSVTQSGSSEQLLVDIYHPENDNATERPLLVLAHGGGFINGDKSELADAARFFAQSGYVVALISYRVLDVQLTQTSIRRAVIDAVFDMKAAVRFFRKDLAESNIYKIDSDNIFVGGFSAGAFMALHYAYLSSNTELETAGGTELVNYVSQNGGLEGNSGNADYSSNIKGVINIAGALFRADFIEAGDPILYSIHGTSDAVVPYLEGNANETGVITQGSGLIHPVANQVGIVNELNTINGGGHSVFLDDCPTCPAALRQFLFNNLQ